MADWYCSSVAYAAIAAWQASHAYSVGDIVRQSAAPSVGNERAFRCTTAGTSGGSEPSWTLTKGGTTASGSATFTEVTGNSTYGWGAASARLKLVCNASGPWSAAGDTVYVASDHNETSSGLAFNINGTAAAPLRILCVNPAGSVPPVSADLTTGAIASATLFSLGQYAYIQGITFVATSTSLALNGGDQVLYFKNCAFRGTAGAAQTMIINVASTDNSAETIFDNCTVEFSHANSGIRVAGGKFTWKNTSGALVSGTLPSTLFLGETADGHAIITLDGVDLSALGSGKTIIGAQGGTAIVQLINCRLGASVTVATTPALPPNRVEVINCDSGATGYRNEIYDYSGTLTVETTIVRSSGASDGVQAVSWKIVTSANCSRVFPFRAFPIPIWNTATGSSKTATAEMVNDGATLKDSEAALEVAYLGSSSYPLASRVTTGAADLLNTGSNIATSSVTWTTTGLSSPVKQKMAASFTPQMIGLARAQLVISKASQTLYVCPKIDPLT